MSSRALQFLFFLFVALCASETDFKIENDVYILSTANLEHFLSTYPIALVNFHIPWCKHCKTLAPEYDKAAAAMKHVKPFVPLAKVDVVSEKQLATKYGLRLYPAVFLFRDREKEEEYQGPREAAAIVEWVRRKADPDYEPAFDWAHIFTIQNALNFLLFFLPALVVILALSELSSRLFKYIYPPKRDEQPNKSD